MKVEMEISDQDGGQTASRTERGRTDGKDGRVDWLLTRRLRADAQQDWNWHLDASCGEAARHVHKMGSCEMQFNKSYPGTPST